MPNIDLAGVRIDLPEGWRAVHAVFLAPPAAGAPMGLLPTLAGGAGFRDTIAIAAQPVPKGTTLESYHQTQLRELNQAGENVRILNTEEVELGGKKVRRTELSQTGPGGERLKQLQITLIQGEEAWVAVGTSLEGPTWTQTRASFEKILGSFRL